MIDKVTLKYFKGFEKESFDLKDAVVLAGQNNAGKTTLFQAIATWAFALRQWQQKRDTASVKQKAGVALTRKEFLSVPVQTFNLLWTDTLTALKKGEEEGKCAGAPRVIEITLEGRTRDGEPWDYTMEFRYANAELLYAKPRDRDTSHEVSGEVSSVVYIPSFSGIEIEEKVHAPAYQDWLIGQGKPGDIIRNLLAEASQKEDAWKELSHDVETIFGYRLLKPQYEGRPFILCQYLPGIPEQQGYGGYPRLDIANAGSGFLQTLLLLAFIYARPSTVLLLDEPDAHMHVLLQKRIYDHLRTIASKRHCQLVVATHSEVVIENTDPNKILSFYGKPHPLVREVERDGVREALKRLTSQDIALAERGNVLYVEDSGDFSILRTWARKLNHPLKKWFSEPYYHPVKGGHTKAATDHFLALRALNDQMSGVLVLDGDTKDAPEHDTLTSGVKVLRWTRHEIANYLVYPSALERFLKGRTRPLFELAATKELRRVLPPEVMSHPRHDHEYLRVTSASKAILPGIFSAACLEIGKMEYYHIAESMRPEEIHREVGEKLDAIAKHFEIYKKA